MARGVNPVMSRPPNGHAPRRQAIQTGQRVEEGGLAGTVRPDQAKQLAFVQLEVNASSAVSPPKRTVSLSQDSTGADCRAHARLQPR